MLRWFERVLWGSAILSIGIYLATTGERWENQAQLNAEFTHAVEVRRATPVLSDATDVTRPIGRLEIPSINVSAIVIEGDDARTLRRGIGHIPGTALPGGSGNVGLSAHRDTFFRHLGQIRTGDPVWITTLKGRYKYVVESSGIVDPDEGIVLHDIGRPTLTLVTCYPFHYVGSAPKRFVVHAALSGSDSNN